MKHVVTTLLCALLNINAHAAERLIEHGKVLNESIISAEWSTNDKQLSAHGIGTLLTCQQNIAAGDFTIHAKLALKELNSTAASFMLGNAHFGFDGRGNTFFLEGSGFPKKSLGSNENRLKAGQPFLLTVTRKSEQLSFAIDGQNVTTFTFHTNEIAGFGFRPHRNTIHLSDLSFEGTLTKYNKPCEAIIPQAKMGWPLWQERFNKFNAQAKQGDIEILLLGDSITHYWQDNKMNKTDGQAVWDKYFNGKKVTNFGIGSDRTQHLLYRLQNGNLDGIQPKYVVLMIGTNNTTSGHTPEEIYLGTKAIIDTIQEKTPNTTILLYDIFPRIRNGQKAWQNCENANRLTRSLCDDRKIIHCSINQQLLDENGQPNKAIFFDGIHINEEGYTIWAKDILNQIKRY